MNEQAIKERDIERHKAVEITDQDREIAIADKSKERSKAEKEAKEAEAQAVAAKERVTTARDREVADRHKQIAVIKANEEAEQEAVGIKVAATARKEAALDEAEAIKTTAQAEADAVKIKALADEARYRVEAEGHERLNEAENKLSNEIIRMRIQLETVKQAASIIEASVKPLETIDGMKVINVSGLGGLVGAGNGTDGGTGSGSVADQLVDGLLKYRGLAPVVDSILKEAGIDGGSLEGLTSVLRHHDESGKHAEEHEHSSPRHDSEDHTG